MSNSSDMPVGKFTIDGYTVIIYQDHNAQPPQLVSGARSRGIIIANDCDLMYLPQAHATKKWLEPLFTTAEDQNVEDEELLPIYYFFSNSEIYLTLDQIETKPREQGFLGWIVCTDKKDAEVELEEMTQFLNEKVYRLVVPALNIEFTNIFGYDTDIFEEHIQQLIQKKIVSAH